MAVSSPWQARTVLSDLIHDEPIEIRRVLRDGYLPPDFTTYADQPHTLDARDTRVGGYGRDDRYDFPPELADLVTRCPGDALRTPDLREEDRRGFFMRSLDLTMQGGTTSGVVYPLAVCELATYFRFRNVGGASAGAIAAAVTASAELGRIGRARGHVAAPPTVADPPGTPRVRQGFAGLADLMDWLTQAGTGGPDEYRLAQLFRPGERTHAVFRVAIAAMRGRGWSIPLLTLFAFSRLIQLVAAALVLFTVTLAGWVGARFAGSIRPWWQTIGWGLLDTAAFVIGLLGLVGLLRATLNAVRRWRERRADAISSGTPLGGLRQYTSGRPVPPSAVIRPLITGGVLIILALVDALLRPWAFLGATVVGLAGSFLVTGWVIVAVLRMVNGFGGHGYGLIGGTAPRRRLGLLDRLAAAPRPTVNPSLIPWLSASLSQLAGLPDGTVLRFGHLWYGHDWTPGTSPLAAPVTDDRLVNLELMTTDLTRRRPYRFPLTPSPDPSDRLWLRVDQLEAAGVFPPDVLAVLRTGTPEVAEDGAGHQHTYHPLPGPADLPVIVAVRVSMALPALFQAVPFHRFVTNAVVRDDLGRQIIDDHRQVTTFTAARRPTDPAPVPVQRVEELWFSDGGITSNFPVHFFDAPLPRWPTVSLNLGTHPATNPIEDVWLPQDWDPVPTTATPLGRSGLALPGAILGTAMSWRDSMQSAMPGYRNRIAQVRSRRDEGGTNLFMSTETIASMGLRGVVAGARLKARFSDPLQWERFTWLRLRVALSNLERLRSSTAARLAVYEPPLTHPGWPDALAAGFGAPTAPPPDLVPHPLIQPATIDWYGAQPIFWPAAENMLTGFARAYAPDQDPVDVMTDSTPQPEPRLRQVPQE